MKENLEPVDGWKVLDPLVTMPISRWNLKTQDPANRHIGPMPQDFHAAFGLGESDTCINKVDADGVALAAIQGLYAMVNDQQAAPQEKVAEIEALKRSVVELKAMVTRPGGPGSLTSASVAKFFPVRMQGGIGMPKSGTEVEQWSHPMPGFAGNFTPSTCHMHMEEGR